MGIPTMITKIPVYEGGALHHPHLCIVSPKPLTLNHSLSQGTVVTSIHRSQTKSLTFHCGFTVMADIITNIDMKKKMETTLLGLGFKDIALTMQTHTEKNMANEIETGLICIKGWYVGA